MRNPLFMLLMSALGVSSFNRLHGPLHPYVYKNMKIPTDVGEPLYLTPYIKGENLEGARALSLVTDTLDGLNPVEQPESYSGFLTVKEDTDSNMFFWFIPATDVDPSEAPVVIWLQGGPGSSSLFGLLELHGPFLANYVEPTIDNQNDGPVDAVMNPYAWSKKANMIYIDNPVGAGFSYATYDGLPSNQEEFARDLYEFLLQWFTLFPEYQKNDFYAFGESYGGKWVPTISKKIHDENLNATLKINLVGLGIGDGFISPKEQAVYAEYMYAVDLVDIAQKEVMLEYEEKMKQEIANASWYEAFLTWDENMNYGMSKTGCEDYYEINLCQEPVERDNYDEFLNLQTTRKAIHVGDRPFGQQSNAVYDKMANDFMKSEKDVLEFLLDNYRVLIYDGNFDIICNHYGIKEMFKAMTSWSGQESYLTTESTVYRVANRTAGYLKQVGDFRQVVMRNSGHMVPWSEPKYAQDMFERFLDGSL